MHVCSSQLVLPIIFYLSLIEQCILLFFHPYGPLSVKYSVIIIIINILIANYQNTILAYLC